MEATVWQTGPRRRRAGGFTLIELLAAMTVLAVIAVLGGMGLDALLKSRAALNSEMETTRGMQLMFAQLQSDCANLASAASLPHRAPLVATDDSLTMVRTVLLENQPSRLQIVSYRVQDGVLMRRESDHTSDLQDLDRLWQSTSSGMDRSNSVVLFAGVHGWSMRTWASDGRAWRAGSDWSMATAPGPSASAAVLTGLAISMQLQIQQRATTVTKVFLLGPV